MCTKPGTAVQDRASLLLIDWDANMITDMITYPAKDLANLTFNKHFRPCQFRDGKNVVEVLSWAELSVVFLRWLLENGHLCMHTLPVSNHAGCGKYLINKEKRHKFPNLGADWVKVGVYYIDTKYDADHHRKNILKALENLKIVDPGFYISFHKTSH